MAGVARRSWPREKRRVLIRRKDIREMVKGFLVPGLLLEVEGARRSLSVPVRRRARVEVRAMMDTCVAGEFDEGMEVDGG